MKKKPPPKKKPARKKWSTAELADRLGQQVRKAIGHFDTIETKVDRVTGLIETLRAQIHGRPDNLIRMVDEMGRALSDQIHLLVKCIPPNKGDVLQMKLDQLERRIALLEKEATYTVRHVIAQPPREKRDGTYTAQEPATGSGEADPTELREEGQSGTHNRAQPDDLGQ